MPRSLSFFLLQSEQEAVTFWHVQAISHQQEKADVEDQQTQLLEKYNALFEDHEDLRDDFADTSKCLRAARAQAEYLFSSTTGDEERDEMLAVRMSEVCPRDSGHVISDENPASPDDASR